MSKVDDLFAKLGVDDPAEIAKAVNPSRQNAEDERRDPLAINSGPRVGGEADLWLAVILQALSDARYNAPSSDRDAAIAFLTNDGGKFARRREEVCDLIGIESDWVARKAREYLEAEECDGYIVRGGKRLKIIDTNAPRKKVPVHVAA